MFVVARKAKGTDVHAEFAYIPFVGFNPDEVKWYGTPNQPMVTQLHPWQRRGMLTLFASHPKVFERCELVDLSKLEAK